MLDDLEVLRVDLRHYHGNVRCPAVSAVVGNDRSLSLCIGFLDGFDLLFGHINCGKYKIYSGSNLLYLVYIHNDQFLHCFRHRSIHFPAAADCFFVSFSGSSGACCHRHYLKPGMIFQKGNETLAYHSGSAKDTNS